jgi:hypothetical protein
VGTGHHMSSLFRPLIKKIPLFHPAPHLVLDRSRQPNHLCNPA